MKIKKAVLPVAGFGTRFLPYTKSSPKEMLPIIDTPVIHYVVEEAIWSGIEEIIFITGRGKRAIEDYFDYSPELEETLKKAGKDHLFKKVREISEMAEIVYVRQKEARGLGHAILQAKNLVGNEPFAVLLPDVFIDSKVPCLKQLIDKCPNSSSTILAVKEIPKEKVHLYGIIDIKNKQDDIFELKGVVEKPDPKEAPSSLQVLGRYILSPEIFAFLEKAKPGKGGEVQLTDAINQLCNIEPVFAAKFEGEDFDCGDKLGFLEATVKMALRDQKLKNSFQEILRGLDLK